MKLDAKQRDIIQRLAVGDFRAWLLVNGANRERLAAADDEVLLASMHKIRYESTMFADSDRLTSRAWLAERDFGRLNGEPLLPVNELPPAFAQ